MSGMKDLIRELAPYRSGVVCDGADKRIEILKTHLPFVVHEFPSESTCNGWTVPMKWNCQRAMIYSVSLSNDSLYDHKMIYNGNNHPLGVCSYSNSFDGKIFGSELKNHLYYSDEYDDALIYHCDWLYKPWKRDWGMSVTRDFYNSIDQDAMYHVDIRTTFEPGTMKVAEYVLRGASPESIVFNSHSCHPLSANDGLSGISIGVELMKRLAAVPDRHYTYRLIVGPEHFHSIFYLDRFGRNGIKYAVFLESLGTDGPLALQRSFTGDTLIDRALLNVLEHCKDLWRTDGFRKIVGNDETCWDSAGHEIPCPSLSRVPYKQYHTSHDDAELMDESRMEQALKAVFDAVLIVDSNTTINRNFTGLVCLSHPSIDLYKPMFDPSIPDRRTITAEQRSFNYLMDCLPRYMDGKMTILDIAEKHKLPFFVVFDYVREWSAKGLAQMVRA